VLCIDAFESRYGERDTKPQGLRYKVGQYLLPNLLIKEAELAFPHQSFIIHLSDVALLPPLIALIPAKTEELVQSLPHLGWRQGDISCIEILREACKAVVYHYSTEVKTARGLG
jgi:hypothetical protein